MPELDLVAPYRRNLAPSRNWGAIGTAAAVSAMLLVALGASGNATPEPAAAVDLDAGLAEEPVASSESDQGAEGANEGEGEVASFPVPTFEALAPLPREVDFLARAELQAGKLVVPGAEPRALTVEPALQKKLTALLKSYVVPYGAIAAIEPATGRVLALAEYSHDDPKMTGLPLKAVYPAASIFKIVTGAALLEAGVPADETVCYHGGKRRLSPKLLEDSKRDRRCASLAQAMGHSTNVIFAKLAKRSLDAQGLRGWAERFGFNAPLPFAQPTDVSVANIPEDEFELAKTAAGFGEVFLSPLHAAMLTGAVGQGGVMMSPVLFEGEASQPRRVISQKTAAELADMMELTVTEGTGRRAFRERRRYVLGDARAAGKTGSLFGKNPFRDFSWFVGFAPKDSPKIAVAAVVVNGPIWRVRAPYLAREAMRLYLDPQLASKPGKGASRRRVAHR